MDEIHFLKGVVTEAVLHFIFSADHYFSHNIVMETLEILKSRKSIRHFTDQPVTDEQLHIILEAGQSGPSGKNEQPFDFIITRDHELMVKMCEANGHPFADALLESTCAILVCANKNRTHKAVPGIDVIDAAVATQNMILAAWDLGIGSCWLGVQPAEDRVAHQTELFNLPEGVIPHSIIAMGTPVKYPSRVKNMWDETKLHWDQW